MSTGTKTIGACREAWSELQSALDHVSNGIRDPEAARKSRERMNRLREENRKRLGVQNIVVDLIRRARESR